MSFLCCIHSTGTDIAYQDDYVLRPLPSHNSFLDRISCPHLHTVFRHHHRYRNTSSLDKGVVLIRVLTLLMTRCMCISLFRPRSQQYLTVFKLVPVRRAINDTFKSRLFRSVDANPTFIVPACPLEMTILSFSR